MSAIVLRCTLGDLEISTGLLTLPLRGNWSATLGIGWPDMPDEGTPAQLRFTREDGTVDVLYGAIKYRGIVPGTENLSVTIHGGAGKLLTAIGARHHTAGASTVPAGLVAVGILGTAGEAIAAGVETALDAVALARWTRLGGLARDAVDVLAYVLGKGWRVVPMGDDGGKVWIGDETWPPVDGSLQFVDGTPEDGVIEYAPDGVQFLPGTTIDGVRAIEVVYVIEPGHVRCEARCALPGDRAWAPDLDAYRTSYPGTVKDQDSTGLHIVCDSPIVGDDLRSIPALVAIPGITYTVPQGTRVRVSFEGADPRGAVAIGIDLDTNATKALALVGGETENGYVMATCQGAPVVFVFFPPGTMPIPPGAVPMVGGKIKGPGHKYAKGVPG